MNRINILHLNFNYEVSTIYPNMFYKINKLPNISGRLYYPVTTNKILKDKNDGYIDTSNCLNKFDRYFYFKRNKKLFNNIIDLYNIKQFDMIIAYSLFSNGFLAYSLKKKFSIPYIIIVQNTDINLYFKRMVHLRNIGRNIIKEAYKIIFISDSYKQLLFKKYLKNDDLNSIEKKSLIIPFGIDDFWIENKSCKKDINNKGKIKLLYVGKINKNKNVIAPAKACEILTKRGYDVSFTVVGEIQDKNIFRKLMKYNFVNYISFLPHEKLLNIYRENDIFIMTSFKESFGLVYAEAMSQGLPVIYTRGQGFDKQFKDGEVGYNVNPTDINEIVEKIIKIYDNYDYFTKNCSKLVDKFKWTNITKKYLNVIKEVKVSKM